MRARCCSTAAAPARAAAFSHDGKKFITGDWAGQIQVWNSADGKKLGDLSAAPHPIATRLAEFQRLVAAQNPLIVAATKKHQDLNAAIPAVQSRGTEAQKQIAALTQQRQAAEGELQNARKAIAAATASRDQADAANKPKFEEQLKQANAALGATTGKIANLDKQLADANNALKARQAELKTAQDNANKAKAELDAAHGKLAALKKQQQFWQAAQINTQRLGKNEQLEKLKAELEFLKEDQAAAGKVVEAAQAKVAAAQKAAADAPGVTATKQKLLGDARAKIPAIDNKLRLTAVILENKRIAVENLSKVEPKTEELKPVQAAATKEHQEAIARQKAELAEKAAAEKAIAAADAALKAAHAAQTNAPKVVEAAMAELAAARAKHAEMGKSVQTKASEVTQADTESKNLWTKYQATLPK